MKKELCCASVIGFLLMISLTATSIFAGELHGAVNRGDLDKVKQLVKQGADVDEKNRQGVVALIYAAQAGQTEIVEFLIASGADVNQQIPDALQRFAPLHLASGLGRLGVVRALLSAGADLNIKNINGVRPLHSATENGHNDIILLLLKKGAEVNATDLNNMTPLHWAVREGSSATVEILLKNGADDSFKDRDGRTAMELALKTGDHSTQKMIRQYGTKLDNQQKMIQDVQSQLWERVYEIDMFNGEMTPITIKAVMAYQRDSGLDPNGKVSTSLVDHLTSTNQFNFILNNNGEAKIKANTFISYNRLVNNLGWNHGGITVRGGSINFVSGADVVTRCSTPDNYSSGSFCFSSSSIQEYGNLEIKGSFVASRFGLVFMHGSQIKIIK